jgi:hypothetical protein
MAIGKYLSREPSFCAAVQIFVQTGVFVQSRPEAIDSATQFAPTANDGMSNGPKVAGGRSTNRDDVTFALIFAAVVALALAVLAALFLLVSGANLIHWPNE